jgi:hypothetical protein
VQDPVELSAEREKRARELLQLPLRGELVPLVRARVEAGIDPALRDAALDHLCAAVDHERLAGAMATGSGEGLASVAARHRLRLACAWLLSTDAPDEAREIADALAGQDLHASLRPELAALIERVQGRAT